MTSIGRESWWQLQICYTCVWIPLRQINYEKNIEIRNYIVYIDNISPNRKPKRETIRYRPMVYFSCLNAENETAQQTCKWILFVFFKIGMVFECGKVLIRVEYFILHWKAHSKTWMYIVCGRNSACLTYQSNWYINGLMVYHSKSDRCKANPFSPLNSTTTLLQ